MTAVRSQAESTGAPHASAVSTRAQLVLLVAALVVRLAILSRLSGNLAQDPDHYRALAEGLLTSGVFGLRLPTAYRPPLYPLMLVPCVALSEHAEVAIGGLHLLLGVATVAITVRLGMLWGLGRGSLVAGALVACDPILLNQSALVMTETAAPFLAAAALWAMTWLGQRPATWRTMIAGLLMALASLCRPTFLPWAAVILVVLLWQLAIPWPRRLLLGIAFCLAVGIGLAPWIVRNQLLFGKPIASTTHGGYTFYLANNPSFYRWLRSDSPTAWQVPQEVASLDGYTDLTRMRELDRNQRAYDLAWEAIRDDPLMFAWSCVVRIGHLWRPLPQQLNDPEGPIARTSRWVVAGWYSAVYLLALAGLWRLKRQTLSLPWMWGLSLVACITLIHTFYWSNMRMRAPAVPVISLVAAAAFQPLLRRNSSLAQETRSAP